MIFDDDTDYALDVEIMRKLFDISSRFNDGTALSADQRRDLAQRMQALLAMAEPLSGAPPDTGWMSPDRYRHLLEALNLSITEAGKFFAVNDRRARRWAEGKAPIPRANAMLLEVLLNYELEPIDAESLLEDDD